MSISNAISDLTEYLDEIYSAIETKCGTVPENKNIENLPDAVASIPSA